MRISTKGRYALVAMITLAQGYSAGENITVISISERYSISKIYLEQVFSLLKRGGLVSSVKGAQGGYTLTKHPSELNAFDVLSSVELSLFEPAELTVEKSSPEIEKTITSVIFEKLDETVKEMLQKVSLFDLTVEVEKNKNNNSLMFYI